MRITKKIEIGVSLFLKNAYRNSQTDWCINPICHPIFIIKKNFGNDFLFRPPFGSFFILFFNFTILYWFCHISKWIHHRYACVPHPEHSSLLPPHTILLGRPSAPAPSIQYLALNLGIHCVDASCYCRYLSTKYLYFITSLKMFWHLFTVYKAKTLPSGIKMLL